MNVRRASDRSDLLLSSPCTGFSPLAQVGGTPDMYEEAMLAHVEKIEGR
jgi:hypothetical protein